MQYTFLGRSITRSDGALAYVEADSAEEAVRKLEQGDCEIEEGSSSGEIEFVWDGTEPEVC